MHVKPSVTLGLLAQTTPSRGRFRNSANPGGHRLNSQFAAYGIAFAPLRSPARASRSLRLNRSRSCKSCRPTASPHGRERASSTACAWVLMGVKQRAGGCELCHDGRFVATAMCSSFGLAALLLPETNAQSKIPRRPPNTLSATQPAMQSAAQPATAEEADSEGRAGCCAPHPKEGPTLPSPTTPT